MMNLDTRSYDSESRVIIDGPDEVGPNTGTGFEGYITAMLGPQGNTNLPGQNTTIYTYDAAGNLLSQRTRA